MDHLKKLGNKGWAVLDVVSQQVCNHNLQYIRNQGSSAIYCIHQSNKSANKLGTESFWPMSLNKENEKAAAILRAFTRDGFHVNSHDRNGNNTKSLVKNPPRVRPTWSGVVLTTIRRSLGRRSSGKSLGQLDCGTGLSVFCYSLPIAILNISLSTDAYTLRSKISSLSTAEVQLGLSMIN
jgi:hypothetical protein